MRKLRLWRDQGEKTKFGPVVSVHPKKQEMRKCEFGYRNVAK